MAIAQMGDQQVRRITLLGLAPVLLAGPPAEAAECPPNSVTAVVTRVWDGGTIEVGGMPIRLQGLTAPKVGEPGGERAARGMEKLGLGREIHCELNGERTDGRCTGVCYLDGEDIAETMVRQGLARDCPRLSDRRYAKAEHEAAVDGATIQQTHQLPAHCNRL
jgi:endonuclease YncB( thermonuclease family)